MSVSDPLIKDLKVCTSKFLEDFRQKGFVDDIDNNNLVNFCNCLEKIFFNGIISVPNSFGFIRHNDPWIWLEKIGNTKYDLINYSFVSSVENIKDYRNVTTNTGKFRLLIRFCLKRKCLHIPVEYMINTGKLNRLYDINSILGDEILSEIFLSVLYQCSKITFKFDLRNTSFLDLSWILPDCIHIEVVPTQNLGMSVSFTGEKAVIIQIKSNSVCSESGQITVGDILDSLNGIYICSATKGRLGTLLKCQKGLPINLTIIKAINPRTKQLYPPITKLYKEINLDADFVKSKINQTSEENTEFINKVVKRKDDNMQKKTSSGFKVIYVGYVEVGKHGDVKQIDKAVNILLTNNHRNSYDISKSKKYKLDVLFEIGELGVKSLDGKNEEILKHSFMEISACGSVMLMPRYFCYIAGEEYCNVARKFCCYIFMAQDDEIACTILQSIGQGFHRTHYAV